MVLALLWGFSFLELAQHLYRTSKILTRVPRIKRFQSIERINI